jgi:hypothetical protein
MMRLLPALLALPLLVAYGVAEGVWTNRWFLPVELEQAPQRLARLPLELGPWQGEDDTLEPRIVRQADLHAHILRRYSHRQTGETLSVLAVCGRPGPVAAHGPEVCMGGSGFVPSAPRTRYAVATEGLPGPALWAERYHKAGAALPEHVRIYYGWNPGSGWQAADRPRLTFASARALYKLYVTRPMVRPDEPAEQDPVPEFLSLLIPELDRCLFGPVADSAEDPS